MELRKPRNYDLDERIERDCIAPRTGPTKLLRYTRKPTV